MKKIWNLNFQLTKNDCIEMNLLFQRSPFFAKRFQSYKFLIFFILVLCPIPFLVDNYYFFSVIAILILWFFVVQKLDFVSKLLIRLFIKPSIVLEDESNVIISEDIVYNINKTTSKTPFDSLKYIAKNNKVICLFFDYNGAVVLPVGAFVDFEDFEVCANYISVHSGLEFNDKKIRTQK